MTAPDNKGKFAVSNGPVNRRTAAANQRTTPRAEPTVVLTRIKAAQTKLRLGAALSQRISQTHAQPKVGKIKATAITQAIGCTVAGIGIFVGAIQGTWGLAGVSLLAFAGLATWAWWSHRARKLASPSTTGFTGTWIEPEDLQRLDALLEQLAQESNTGTIERLVAFKDALSRCVTLVNGVQHTGLVSSDDVLFVRETIRRYVPDSIQACLKVPAVEREHRVIEDGKTALDLLHGQLDLIARQLQQRETQFAQLSGESLLQQQRFLAAKTQTPSR